MKSNIPRSGTQAGSAPPPAAGPPSILDLFPPSGAHVNPFDGAPLDLPAPPSLAPRQALSPFQAPPDPGAWHRAPPGASGAVLWYRPKRGGGWEYHTQIPTPPAPRPAPPGEMGALRGVGRRMAAGVRAVRRLEAGELVGGGVSSTRLDTVQTSRQIADKPGDRTALDRAHNASVVKALEDLPVAADPDLEIRVGKALSRMRVCKREIGLKQCDNCDSVKIHRHFCGQYRLCITCARIRARMLAAEILDIRKGIKEYQGYSWKLITVTLPTSKAGGYRVDLRRLIDGFARLWRSAVLHPKAPGRAALRSVEFGELSGHLHAHVLYYGPYIDKPRLAARWLDITGDAYIVDVRRVDTKKGWTDAISEVTKYLSSMGKIPAARLVEFWNVLDGSRALARYGALLGEKGQRDAEPLAPLDEVCTCCGYHEFTYITAPALWLQEILKTIKPRGE